MDSVSHFPPTCDFEVLVVDNQSMDGSQFIVAQYSHARLIQNKENRGFSFANNQAFNCSRGEYILMLNPDTEVKDGSLDKLLACADAHPSAGLISAKLLNLDGSPQIGFNVRRLPGFASAAFQLLLINEVFPSNPIARQAGCFDLDYGIIQAVEQPAASALLYRRLAWSQVGGFDETFLNWYNDVDLCARVRKSGWDILFCPSALITHHGGMGSAFRVMKGVMVEGYRSQRLYFLKHFGLLGYWVVNTLILSGMLLRMLTLRICPRSADHVNTRTKRNKPNAEADAYGAVFLDTLKSWRILTRERQRIMEDN